MNVEEYATLARGSPRVTSLMDYFARLAVGQIGAPSGDPVADEEPLVRTDAISHRFYERYRQLAGRFTAHFGASVPCAIAEECRIGAAIWQAAQSGENVQKLYTLGSAEGVIARTVVSLVAGRVRSLSCSPNLENEREFHARGCPEGSSFYCGTFVDVVEGIGAKDERFAAFHDGFDFIIEDTTFQMYSRERMAPLAMVASILKPEGVVVLMEKLLHPDPLEDTRRERRKNAYKRRYLSEGEIEQKAKIVLSLMREQQTTLESLAADVGRVLGHCALVWNSGNFYGLAASRSSRAVEAFVARLPPPMVASDFRHEDTPRRLCGLSSIDLRFRPAIGP